MFRFEVIQKYSTAALMDSLTSLPVQNFQKCGEGEQIDDKLVGATGFEPATTNTPC